MTTSVNLQPFAQQVIKELGLDPDASRSARELIEQASLKLAAIAPDTLTPEARRTHAQLGLAVGVLKNANPEAASQAFAAVIASINTKETGAFIADVHASIARAMELQPVFTVHGAYFPTEEAARSYSVGVAMVDAFANIRTAVGEDTYLKLARGQAYLQHDPRDVEAARKELLAVADRHFGPEARAGLEERLAGRSLPEVAAPFRDAAQRFLLMTADGKEFRSPAHVKNPPEGAVAIAADRALLAFSTPVSFSKPQPYHVTQAGRPVSLRSQLGERAKELALARLDTHLQAAPFDATSGPAFGEHLRDAILALHGERMAKALEDKRWGNVFMGLRDEPISKHVKAYVEWAAADTLMKFDALVTQATPGLRVTTLVDQVSATQGSLNKAVYEQLRQYLVDIEAGSAVAHYVRPEPSSFAFHKLGTWAAQTRQALEKRYAEGEANAASLRDYGH